MEFPDDATYQLGAQIISVLLLRFKGVNKWWKGNFAK